MPYRVEHGDKDRDKDRDRIGIGNTAIGTIAVPRIEWKRSRGAYVKRRPLAELGTLPYPPCLHQFISSISSLPT